MRLSNLDLRTMTIIRGLFVLTASVLAVGASVLPVSARTVCSEDWMGRTVCETDNGRYTIDKDWMYRTVIDGPGGRTTCYEDWMGRSVCD